MYGGQDEQVKVLVCGPSKVGKSCVADYLSNTRDKPPNDYKETAPLRILETVLEGLQIGGRRQMGRGTRAVVELWDLGGNSQFQNCWPAVWKGVDAIIFVMNPEIRNQERELEFWHKSFAQPAKVAPPQCLVFCHHSTAPEMAVGVQAIPQMPPALQGIRALETSLDFQSDNFKETFEQLVAGVIAARREAAENAMLEKQNDGMQGPLVVGVSQ